MATVELRDDLRENLQREADRRAQSVDDLINELVWQYVRQLQREKIAREEAAFISMHPELRRAYPDQWVAIHDGNLVDRDSDRATLYGRVRSCYGSTAVLIRQVREQPVEELRVRTPSTGKLSP